MRLSARVPFLSRMAARYAMRHRAQTVRAILGLLVATSVLATGLGLGESIAGSLEREALSRFGDVDVIVQGNRPFNATLAQTLSQHPAVQAQGATGVTTLSITGAASNPEKKLAEAFATLRGVSAQEARLLGPLRSPEGATIPEPRTGEVVLSIDLAQRLDARVGDRIVLRAPIPGEYPDPQFQLTNFTGATGIPPPLTPVHTVEVKKDAIGMGVFAQWPEPAGALTVEVRDPQGRTFQNTSTTSPLQLTLPPPLEPGMWSIVLTSERPTPYIATAGVVYPPPSLAAGVGILEARVSGIAIDEARAAISFRPAALVPMEDLQRATGMQGRATQAYFRVTGDPHEAVDAIENALPADARDGIRVRAAKADAIEDAKQAGADITGFLLVMGGFTLLAAMLLAFALFSALVEERRAELGIGRALGLTRGEIAFAMTAEGALYAAAAAAVGLVLGVGILWGFITGIDFFSQREGGPTFDVHFSNGTLLLAFLLGTLTPLGTIAVASLRFARLDPARAIRGIPDDAKGKRRVGLAIAGALVLLGLLASTGEIGRLAGIPIILAGVAAALSATGRRRLALLASLAGIAHVLWSLYAFNAWPDEAQELDPIMTMARGALLALGLSALAVASPAPYDALARWVTKRMDGRPAALVSVRYLASRRRAAGLTMGMISLVVVVVIVMGTLFSLFSAQVPTHEAGYDVVGESPLRIDALPAPLPGDVAAQVERTDFMIRHFELRSANVTQGARELNESWGFRSFLGVNDGFAQANRYELRDRASEYATDTQAWQAVARGEALIMPDWALEESRANVGERITLKTAIGNPREYLIAGTTQRQFYGGSFLSAEHVAAMGFPQSSVVFVRAAPGVDPNALAHRLTAEYGESGINFLSIPEEVERVTAGVRAIIVVFEAFLALGLFVGLAGTGFLASRAVHERARDIGTLRALGFEETDVRRLFILEATGTAGAGLLIGTLVGLTVAHSVWWREIRAEGIPFLPPLIVMALFSAAVLGLAALAARGPAKRAAALPPALAVRYVE